MTDLNDKIKVEGKLLRYIPEPERTKDSNYTIDELRRIVNSNGSISTLEKTQAFNLIEALEKTLNNRNKKSSDTNSASVESQGEVLDIPLTLDTEGDKGVVSTPEIIDIPSPSNGVVLDIPSPTPEVINIPSSSSNKAVLDNPSSPEVVISAPNPEDKIEGLEINKSTVFGNTNTNTPSPENKGDKPLFPGTKNKSRLTDAEKQRAIAEKEEKEKLEETSKNQNQSLLSDLNTKLQAKPKFSNTILKLRKIVTSSYGGYIGVKAPITQTNTRIKVRAINTVAPADRRYHPNVSDKDMSKSGKEIEVKYSYCQYDLVIEESNPGTVVGFITMLPAGLTKEHITSLSSALTMADIDILANKLEEKETLNMVPVALDRKTFMSLLLALHVPAYHINAANVRDTTKPYFVVETKQAGVDRFWNTLKARRNDGKVTKLATSTYLPLHTFDTVSYKNVDKVLLTEALFSKLLNTANSYTKATKKSQLTPKSESEFVQTENGMISTLLKDPLIVNAYTSTKTNVMQVTMSYPRVEEGVTSTDGKRKVVFAKSHFTKPTYNESYAHRIAPFKDTIEACSLKKDSPISRVNKIVNEIGRFRVLLDLSEGREPVFDKPKETVIK